MVNYNITLLIIFFFIEQMKTSQYYYMVQESHNCTDLKGPS